jgi:hypothetical protein
MPNLMRMDEQNVIRDSVARTVAAHGTGRVAVRYLFGTAGLILSEFRPDPLRHRRHGNRRCHQSLSVLQNWDRKTWSITTSTSVTLNLCVRPSIAEAYL